MGIGSVTHILKFQRLAVPPTTAVENTLTRYILPTVRADPGVKLSELTAVLLVQPAEFAFNVETRMVPMMAALVEPVLNSCKPGLSSILGLAPLVPKLEILMVGDVDWAVK
jgi:hypothetical protein